MRTHTLIPAALAAALLAGPAAAQDKAEPVPRAPAAGSSKKLKDLRTERVTVLTELVDHAVTTFRNGRGSYEEVLDAQVQLLTARLDLAEKAADRIAILEQTIAALKASEEVARGRVESGRGTAATVLRFRARRLDVEIQLEQAKIREAKEGR